MINSGNVNKLHKVNLCLFPPQGSDGFPGVVGVAGEKGKKVRDLK